MPQKEICARGTILASNNFDANLKTFCAWHGISLPALRVPDDTTIAKTIFDYLLNFIDV